MQGTRGDEVCWKWEVKWLGGGFAVGAPRCGKKIKLAE